MTTIAAIFAATTAIAAYYALIWRDRAVNLDAYNADLRQQLVDVARQRDQYCTSNRRMIAESVQLVAEAHYYRNKYSWLGVRRHSGLRKHAKARLVWAVKPEGRG